jgi:simple sugar transport system substrate-binding protein
MEPRVGMNDKNEDKYLENSITNDNTNVPTAAKPVDDKLDSLPIDTTTKLSTDNSAESSASDSQTEQTISLQKPPKANKFNKGTLKKILVTIVIAIVVVGGSITIGYFIRKANTHVASKLCSGANIVFFAGGTPTDSFASVVYQGARQAQQDLGPNVQYEWSDWNTTTMVNQFLDAISKTPAPTGIAMMGHPGPQALGPLIAEAESKNIIVTMQNVDIPTVREQYTTNGFGYVGQDLTATGEMVSEGVIREFNPAPGTQAIVFGVNPVTEPSRYPRTQGIVDGLTSDNIVVHQITLPANVEANPSSDAAKQMFASALSEFPDAKIMIIDHGALTSATPAILQGMGIKPGQYIIAGFDLSPTTVQGIKDGYISLVSDQQPFLQGYLPILQICLSQKYQFSGLDINTGTGLIDKSNVGPIEKLVDEHLR